MMKDAWKILTALGIASLFFFACGPMIPRTPTTAELEMQQNMMNIIQQRMNGNNLMAQDMPTSGKTPLENTMTEAEMADKISLVPAIENGLQLNKKKDGFDFNGSRYIDPEGVIAAYFCNPVTGDATYFAITGQDSISIKWVRVTSGSPALTIGKAQKRNDLWTIKTTTGKTITGNTLTPLSKGILVGRDSTGFLYIPGNELIPLSCPDGFRIAQFQNGEIEETGYVLIERMETSKNDQMGSLVSGVKNLGSTFGINKKEDYVLFNYNTQNQIPINVNIEGKKVAVYSNLVDTHAHGLIREYSNVDFFESLYNPKTGSPNSEHYYWRISWFDTESGPFLIVRESGKPKVTALNLNTGKKVLMFERLLGVNWMSADKMANGKIQVTAKLGLSKKTIDDAEAFLKSETAL